MDTATIIMYILQTAIAGIIGVAAWGMKNAMDGIKSSIAELKNVDKEQAERIERVQAEINALKSDLPLVYVTQESFIRVTNNIDRNIGKIDQKLDRLVSMGGTRKGD